MKQIVSHHAYVRIGSVSIYKAMSRGMCLSVLPISTNDSCTHSCHKGTPAGLLCPYSRQITSVHKYIQMYVCLYCMYV